MKNKELELGNRKDFWNTLFNPITGWTTPSSNNESNGINTHSIDQKFLK